MVSRWYVRAAGFSLVEILVTMVIVMIGLLGLLGVQVRSHQAELEAYQRAQALVLMADIVDRLNGNRQGNATQCYAITTDTANGAPYLGTGSSTPTCTAWGVAATQAKAVADLIAWDDLLKGAAETDAGASVGAMVGARGCISGDAVTRTYQVSVAWQGVIPTAAPLDASGNVLTCGTGLYGNENLRRVVSTTVRIADLN
jgi:type IV pilus assembly protein PilV